MDKNKDKFNKMLTETTKSIWFKFAIKYRCHSVDCWDYIFTHGNFFKFGCENKLLTNCKILSSKRSHSLQNLTEKPNQQSKLKRSRSLQCYKQIFVFEKCVDPKSLNLMKPCDYF